MMKSKYVESLSHYYLSQQKWICSFLQNTVIFSVVLLFSMLNSEVKAESICDKEIINKSYEKSESVSLEELQRNLNDIGYSVFNKGKSEPDGQYGEKTNMALLELCEDLEFTGVKVIISEMNNVLSNYEKIDKDILKDNNEEYIKWLEVLEPIKSKWLVDHGSGEYPRSSVIYKYYVDGRGDGKSDEVDDWEKDEKETSVKWEVDSCGCASDLSTNGYNKKYLYGFYEGNKIKKTVVDYSVLSRIGYVLPKLNAEYEITDLNQWVYIEPYTKIINETHKHKSKIDFVISDSNWEKWSYNHIEDKIGVKILIEEYIKSKSSKLTDDLVDIVKEPIKWNLINAMKPISSFGTSPARTMGDGITIDFKYDFSSRKAKESENVINAFNQYKYFINILKCKLSLEKVSNEYKRCEEAKVINKISSADEYYLNIKWPIDDILSNRKAGFYSVKNMLELSDSVNLFIVYMDVNEDGKGYLNKDDLIKIKNIIDSNVPVVSDAKKLLNKIIPLYEIRNNNVKESIENRFSREQFFSYSEDNFSGIAMSDIAKNQKVKDSIIDAFINVNSVSSSALAYNGKTFCDNMCPHRWVTRIALFFIFAFFIVYALISMWICESKSILGKWYFIFGCFTVAMVAIITLGCDPWWKHRHEALWIAVVVISVLSMLWGFMKKRIESLYP